MNLILEPNSDVSKKKTRNQYQEKKNALKVEMYVEGAPHLCNVLDQSSEAMAINKLIKQCRNLFVRLDSVDIVPSLRFPINSRKQ